MRNYPLLLSLFWAVTIIPGYCQEEPGTLQFDTSKMKVTIAMDRETYLPGEAAQVTFEVSNPSSTAVVSLVPFIPATGCLSTLRYLCGYMPIDSSLLTTFGPGETKRIVLNSYGSAWENGPPVMETGATPTLPGKYRIAYQYGNSTAAAEYTVLHAKLEADAVARLHDFMSSDRPGWVPRAPVPTYVHVLALRADQASYICVSQHDVGRPDPVAVKSILDQHPDFDYQHVQIGLAHIFKRIATSPGPVVSLSVASDSQENLTITWKDADGGEHTEFYLASYPERDAHERAANDMLDQFEKARKKE
jgi:hypothetical protein